MSKNEKFQYGPENIQVLKGVDAIRRRPGMYVGGTGLFGLINYAVIPFNILLHFNASVIDVIVDENGIQIESDADLSHVLLDEADPPFKYDDSSEDAVYEVRILAALSAFLDISIFDGSNLLTLEYVQSKRTKYAIDTAKNAGCATQFRFAPDGEVFSATAVPEAIFKSYFCRISHLHAGVEFRLNFHGSKSEYYAENGIQDLFRAFSAPYQLLHEPIYFRATKQNMEMELIFAFHSWTQNWILPFINHGRTAEGGTHKDGLMAAFDEIAAQFAPTRCNNGIVAIMTIMYPGVVYEGCIKNKVGNEELFEWIKALVLEHGMLAINQDPELKEQLAHLEIFQFPEAWFWPLKGQEITDKVF